MPSPLMIDNLYSSPQRFDWERVNREMDDLVAVPEPGEEDLADYSFSPDDLRRQGHDVPVDPEEALLYAREAFRESEEYREWKQGFLPVMTVLWPCRLRISPKEAIAAFRREGIACTVVAGDVNGSQVSGIALTGGGMDLSDHIAAAYVICGQVPPVQVIESALRIQNPVMEKELLAAAEEAAGACVKAAENIRALSEARRSSCPSP